MKLTPHQVNTISKGDQEIAGYFNEFLAIIAKQSEHLEKQTEQIEWQAEQMKKQAKQIDKLEKKVHELERQLGQNSNNSSKPPSSDGLRKPTNMRTPGGKKGAPKGHDGTTLRFSNQPDEIIMYPVTTCSGCSTSLEVVESQGYEKRQVFDLPPPRIWVTEHRAQKKCCPECGLQQRAAFPERVHAPTQYGSGFTSWTAYLHAYQMIPLERISRMFSELTGYQPSEATLLSSLQTMFHSLEGAEETIRTQLFQKSVVHVDETGCRIQGKTHWMHVVSDADWTLLGVHPKRGSLGMDELRFIPFYTGTIVHDCLPTYFKDGYSFDHALCNAHLLRECQGIAEHDGHEWATQMKELLQESWKLVQSSRQNGIALPKEVIEAITDWYDDILERAKSEWENDIVRVKTSSKGRKIKSKAANLGERLLLHKASIIRFLWDVHIPFDNNQAERDLRMVKVKQKVSGSFRTELGAKTFARMRSVISTLLKQQLPVLSSLTSALHGKLSFRMT